MSTSLIDPDPKPRRMSLVINYPRTGLAPIIMRMEVSIHLKICIQLSRAMLSHSTRLQFHSSLTSHLPVLISSGDKEYGQSEETMTECIQVGVLIASQRLLKRLSSHLFSPRCCTRGVAQQLCRFPTVRWMLNNKLRAQSSSRARRTAFLCPRRDASSTVHSLCGQVKTRTLETHK